MAKKNKSVVVDLSEFLKAHGKLSRADGSVMNWGFRSDSNPSETTYFRASNAKDAINEMRRHASNLGVFHITLVPFVA